jgi:biotin-(acetyl-CoA carboxylase) ligase
MPLATNFAPTLDLPPPYRLIKLREVGDAFTHAKAVAAEAGAGTLVFVSRFDLAEFALVLEPDEPLCSARRIVYAGMCALGDALAALAPPHKPISYEWPDSIRVDGGLVGGVRLAWPPGAEEEEPPPWLVLGAVIRTVSMTESEAGLRPLETTLSEEGFDDLDSARLVEVFSRHFMAAIDTWREIGFGEIINRYLPRLTAAKGVLCKIDQNGDLLLQRAAAANIERHALAVALAAPSWPSLMSATQQVPTCRYDTRRPS